MPQGINHSRQDFRNKLPLHTDYPVVVCYGICCSFPRTIWYLSASKNNEEHRSPALQFPLGALPVFKWRADESTPVQSGTGSCVATPLPQCTNTSHLLSGSHQTIRSTQLKQAGPAGVPGCLHLTTQTWCKSMRFGHHMVHAIQWSGPDQPRR